MFIRDKYKDFLKIQIENFSPPLKLPLKFLAPQIGFKILNDAGIPFALGAFF